MSELKTYSGELKNGMPYKYVHGVGFDLGLWGHAAQLPDEVYVDNEWQLYKPQPKKVWGIPSVGQKYYVVTADPEGIVFVVEMTATAHETVPNWLSREHAEQQAKAENMRDEFRLLSDAPVDGVEQFYVTINGGIAKTSWIHDVLMFGVFGVSFKTLEQAEQALAKFPHIHIANKIDRMAFHGIVEEKL